MIERYVDDGVAVLRMAHGRANALDVEFAAALAAALKSEETQRERTLVLTGSGHIFSAGVDLLRITEGGASYVGQFLGVLRVLIHALLVYPKPIVAAVNGHAVAGGCVMAAACDHRVMATGGGRVGIPELKVGVPFPTAAVEAMRLVTPAHRLQDTVYGGETYPTEQALTRGLIDELVEPERLMPRALERARELARIPPDTFRLTKEQIRRPAVNAVQEAEADGTEDAVGRAWGSPPVLEAVRAYVRETLGK